MEPFIGQLMLFAGNFAPRGWALCQGQILPIAQYQALFSILGTTYGGNGQTTFALPDLRGRAPLSSGQGPGLSGYALGQSGGRESVTLATANMPAHTHPVQLALTFAAPASTAPGDTDTPGPGAVPAGASGSAIYGQGARDTTLAGAAVGGNVNLGNTGGNQPFDSRPPYLTLNWCIALEGIFPARG